MLNSLNRLLSTKARLFMVNGLTKRFGNGLRFKPRSSKREETYPSIEFLSQDGPSQPDEEDAELELDIEHLRHSIHEENTKLITASAGQALEKYKIVSNPDFRHVVDHQDEIFKFSFVDFGRLTDSETIPFLQRMIDSSQIKQSVKLKLLCYIEKLQTPANLTSILTEAFQQNFVETHKELTILIGAAIHKNLEIHQQLVDHIVQLFRTFPPEKLNDGLKKLADFMPKQIEASNRGRPETILPDKKKPLPRGKGQKGRLSQKHAVLEPEVDRPTLQNPENVTTKEFLSYLKLCLEKSTATPIEEIKRIEADYPEIDLIKLLDFDLNLISELNYEQKYGLCWLFWQLSTHKKISVKHKEKLVPLLDNLLIYDQPKSNYLARSLMGKPLSPRKVSNYG